MVHVYQMATSKTWTRTLDPNPEKPGPRKTWTLFQAKNCSYNNTIMIWKSWNLRFYSPNIVCRQYWSSEQICSGLKVWMSRFLNIRSSHLEVSCKKLLLIFLQNSLKNIKNIRDAVFDLKFLAKRFTTLLKRGSGVCAFRRIWQKF